MAPHIPPVPATCAPQLAYRSWFTGALLPVCDVEVLIVVVEPRIMFDTYEANLYVSAFNLRFKRTIVLLSQDPQTLVPTYYGPAGIVRALSTLPFELIPWQHMLYCVAKPPAWKLPIPPERPATHSNAADETGCYSSIEELARTHIRDPDLHDLREAAERIARTTRR
ncbi:MAG: hypothetical protein M4D80_12410 [Myxococcota bacterium]|nr:hypothetical protein [Myxococcota bacterium]